MLRLAFSTVATPDWTLPRVVEAAAQYGYDGVELRSMGRGGAELACEPALTDGAKVRRLFADAGLTPSGVASGCTFDAPVNPPVMGELLKPHEKIIANAKQYIDIAHEIGASYARVYAFKIPNGERRHRTLTRIARRLAAVCTHARHRNVSVVIENGGDFSSASDLAEIINVVGSPYLMALYDLEAGMAVGDQPRDAVRLLGRKLIAARIKDSLHGRPCALGKGSLPCRELIRAMREANSSAWLVYTWDRAWLSHLAPSEEMLPHAARQLAEWASAGGSGGVGSGAASGRSLVGAA
ncbi:MAG TPA: sugar phosphate isomerase/epimerase [Phycisphaerales bacterium]|nr:sugar phosphate isomerase/epimerase [Phycisphaerales bacterium]